MKEKLGWTYPSNPVP